MSSDPRAEAMRHAAKSDPQYFRKTSTTTPPGNFTSPDANSRAARIPPTPIPLKWNAA